MMKVPKTRTGTLSGAHSPGFQLIRLRRSVLGVLKFEPLLLFLSNGSEMDHTIRFLRKNKKIKNKSVAFLNHHFQS